MVAMQLARLASAALLLMPLACVVPTDEMTSGEEDLATESAMVSLIGSSKSVVYANVGYKASKTLSGALVNAAHAGVDVHVLLKEGSHDTTWQLQQKLESNGVDVDVVATSPVTGVVMVGDETALVGTKKVTSPSTVAADTKKFEAAFAGTEPAKGSLLSYSVKVLPMPESGRDRIVQVFEAAKSSIDLSIYQLQERRVVAALKNAAARGVTVRVMLEPKTVGGSNESAMEAELSRAKITVHKTPAKFDSSHNVDHAKFAIIDGRELLVGTGNMVRSGLGGVTDDVYANRDFWIEDARATQIGEAKKLFEADWAQQSTSASALGDLVVTPDNADGTITKLVDGASSKLFVYNQSLNDSDLIERLVAAKKRGVDVRVLLGYQPAFGGAPPNASAISQLTAAGIDASYLESHYLHAKAIVADGSVYLGSQNFTSGGLYNNRELGEVLTSKTAVSTVVSTFQGDAAK